MDLRKIKALIELLEKSSLTELEIKEGEETVRLARHNHVSVAPAVANADFLRVGGKDVDDTFLPSGPVLVAEQLPASHPVKKSAMAYVQAYEAAHGKGSVSTFGAHAWDTGLLMAAAIPAALKKAKPGTAEFRVALRDALEQVKDVAGAHGIFSMSPTDHLGLDQRAYVMVKIQNGAWKYQP